MFYTSACRATDRGEAFSWIKKNPKLELAIRQKLSGQDSVSGFRYRVSGIRYQVFCFWFLKSEVPTLSGSTPAKPAGFDLKSTV